MKLHTTCLGLLALGAGLTLFGHASSSSSHVARTLGWLMDLRDAHAETPDGGFQSAAEAYRVDPELCIVRCRQLLETKDWGNKNLRREVQLLLGKACVHAGRDEDARRVLEEIRADDPGYELDAKRHRVLWGPYLRVFGAELRPAPGLRTICVFDFESHVVGPNASEWDGLGSILARKLEDTLASSVELRLVERERIDYILREMELCDKQDPDTRVCAGHLAGAHVMVFGEFTSFGKESMVHVRLAETETSYLLGGAEETVRGTPEETLERIDDLAQEISDRLSVHLQPSAPSSNRFEAWRHYGAGLDFLANGQLAEAHTAFVAALAEDPGFVQVQEALWELPDYALASASSRR